MVQDEGKRSQLSAWLREQVRIHPTFDAATTSLSTFFRDMSNMVAPPRASQREAQPRPAKAW